MLVVDQAQRQRSKSRLTDIEPCYCAVQGVWLFKYNRIAPALMTEIPASCLPEALDAREPSSLSRLLKPASTQPPRRARLRLLAQHILHPIAHPYPIHLPSRAVVS
jgi:hypothetical protein